MPKSAKQDNSHLLEFVFISLSIVTLSLSMFLLSKYFENQTPQVKVLGAQIDLGKEEEFWKKILTKSPTYRDGWIELAKIQEETGNKEKAEIYLQNASTIDPNFKVIK